MIEVQGAVQLRGDAAGIRRDRVAGDGAAAVGRGRGEGHGGLALPAVAVPMVGAPGTVAGVTVFDAADAAPVPMALVAVTVKV